MNSNRHGLRSARILGTVAAVAVAGLTLAGCAGSSTPAATSSGSAGSPSPRSLLPADITKAGEITIVSDTSFGPPWDFNPDSDPTATDGIDPDLARAFTKVLGLKIKWVVSPFDGIVPALKADRYDLAMNGMTDSADREKQIDMIHYVNDSDTIVVASGNPDKITGLADLCGKTVAVATGTHEAQIVEDYQSKCSKPITISYFPTNAPTFLAVKSGRAVATINGYAATFYLQDNKVSGFDGLQGLADVRLGENPQGIGVSKSNPDLTKAIAAALDQMINDGTYGKILTKWGIASNALPKVEINAQS